MSHVERVINGFFGVLNSKKTPLVILLIFGLFLMTAAFCNHYFFRTYAFDYGAYNFAFYDFAHFRVSPSPVYGAVETNFLQDHLSFTMFFFIPLFWAFKWIFGSYTLLFIQSCFIVWGGWATHRLVTERTNSRGISLVTLIMYFMLFGRFSALTGDCNLMIILASFVPVFLLCFHRKKFFLTTLCFLFLILGRESVPLWMIFICILLMINFRKDRQRFWMAALFAVISIIYFILAFKVLIPAFENPDRPFDLFQYSALGKNPFEAIQFLLSHPIDSIKMAFVNHMEDPFYDGVKWEFYTVYLISGGAILLLKPKYLIPFIPIILQKMFNDHAVRWGIESYYGIEFVSLMPLFIGFALGEIKRKPVRVILPILALVGMISMTFYKLAPLNREVYWHGQGKMNPFEQSFYTSPLDISAINNKLARIPKDAKVAATGNVLSHLAFREQINYFPFYVGDVDYIIILDDGIQFMYSEEQFQGEIDNIKNDPKFSLMAQEGQLLIFKKK